MMFILKYVQLHIIGQVSANICWYVYQRVFMKQPTKMYHYNTSIIFVFNFI
jgi:hypothetical protein